MPGMLKIIFGNLFKKRATRLYPFEKRAPFENARGSMDFAHMENCIFCNLCAKNCPPKAITVDRANKRNALDPLRCIQCGVCAEACPKKVIEMRGQYNEPCYAKRTHVAAQVVKCAQTPPEQK
ncbi:MAG: 4Fe-4S binding protein [Candidatus Thermoplasmatota archaeon]|nr:4Fe-4S binding protein [Candidatus Thermoplasmatota archaeon]